MADLSAPQEQRLEVLARLAPAFSASVDDLITAANWVLDDSGEARLAELLRDAVAGDPDARAIVRRLAGIEDDDEDEEPRLGVMVDEDAFAREHDDTVSIQAVPHG